MSFKPTKLLERPFRKNSRNLYFFVAGLGIAITLVVLILLFYNHLQGIRSRVDDSPEIARLQLQQLLITFKKFLLLVYAMLTTHFLVQFYKILRSGDYSIHSPTGSPVEKVRLKGQPARTLALLYLCHAILLIFGFWWIQSILDSILLALQNLGS